MRITAAPASLTSRNAAFARGSRQSLVLDLMQRHVAGDRNADGQFTAAEA
jgi:hypothetical protein